MTDSPTMSKPAARVLTLLSDPAKSIDFGSPAPHSERIPVWDDNEGDFETWTTIRAMDELAAAGHLPADADGRWAP